MVKVKGIHDVSTKGVLMEVLHKLYDVDGRRAMRKVRECLEILMEDPRSYKELQNNIRGEGLEDFRQMIVKEVNKSMKKFEKSDENALRSYQLLLLDLDDLKVEYQNTKNRSFRTYNQEKREFAPNKTGDGILLSKFSSYKRAVSVVYDLMERHTVGVIPVEKVPETTKGAGYRDPEKVVMDFLQYVEVCFISFFNLLLYFH